MPPKFIYFDLGNVILHFSHERMCRQMAEVARVSYEAMHAALFDLKIKEQAEAGVLNPTEYYEALCRAVGTRPDRTALERACNDIFQLNAPIVPLIVALETTGHRIGILSNICENHWRWVSDNRFGVLPGAFDTFALSFELGAAKPSAQIFRRAAELAGVAPEEVLFTDDMPGHVAAAMAAGFDAVPFTTPAALAAAMRKRGIRPNY
ncbi:MAG TPA: HAD-IA family hydrolase [Pirellulales bacterium]|nr:HAD-IA family hydrolase [Pirellulales bacterium]